MGFSIEKKVLLDMLQRCFPFIPTKGSLQVLTNFRFSFDGKKLEITATDLDHSIVVYEEIDGVGPFDTVVNAKKFVEIVRELPDGAVYMNVEDNVMAIHSEQDFSCKLACGDTSSYPEIPQVEPKNSFAIRVSDLRNLVAKSSFAASKDETRTFLCGVLWVVEPSRIGMVATDGHRFGSSFIDGSYSVQESIGPIVSPKSLNHVVRIIDGSDRDSMVEIAVGEKYITFRSGSLYICSKLIDGPYPDFDKVIPKNNPKTAVVDRAVLLETTRRVSVLSSNKNYLEKFVFSGESLEISVLNTDIGGEAREKIPIEYKGEEHPIGFNSHYLVEILSIIADAPRVRLEMNTQISACLIYPVYPENSVQSSNDLFLIMPLRIV